VESIFYWLSRGLESKWGYKLVRVDGDVMVVANGGNTLAIKVLLMDVYNEADIAKGVAEITDAKQEYDKVYLAVPTNALAHVDAKLLKRLGIGLIAFDLSKAADESAIEERIPAKPIPRRRAVVDDARLVGLVEDLVRKSLESALSSRLAELESRIKRYVDEKISEISREISRIKPQPQPTAEVPTAELKELPEFIRENQWVRIIQERRR